MYQIDFKCPSSIWYLQQNWIRVHLCKTESKRRCWTCNGQGRRIRNFKATWWWLWVPRRASPRSMPVTMTTWPQPTQRSWYLSQHLLLHLVPWAAPTQYPWSTGQNGNNKKYDWMNGIVPSLSSGVPDHRCLFNLAWSEFKLFKRCWF